MKPYNDRNNKIIRLVQSIERQIEQLRKLIKEIEKNPTSEKKADHKEELKRKVSEEIRK